MKDVKSFEPPKSRTSPAAETSDPPASAFLERRPLKQEDSLAYPENASANDSSVSQIRTRTILPPDPDINSGAAS
jgi:hypothetical protein